MVSLATCPLCQSQDHKKRFSERGYDVLHCQMCELFFIHPYPTASDRVHEQVSTYNYEEFELVNPERKYQAEV